MEAILLILGFFAYVAFIGITFYLCCKSANEVDSDDENFLK